jgi:hypothetical protein
MMGVSMRLAQIVDGVVVNVAEVEPGKVPEFMADWVPAGSAGPGWLYDGEAFTAPSLPTADPKLVGVEFQGVMCSATANDQNGLAAVLLAIQLQGPNFQPTRFQFDNGSTLVITLANWEAFAAVWLPFRQSFFAVPT